MGKAVLVNGGERYVLNGRLFRRGVEMDVSDAEATILGADTVLDKRGNLVRRFRISGLAELVRAAAPSALDVDENPDLIVRIASEIEQSGGLNPSDDSGRGDMTGQDLGA